MTGDAIDETANPRTDDTDRFGEELLWKIGVVCMVVGLMMLMIATSPADSSELHHLKTALTVMLGLMLMTASVIIQIINYLADRNGHVGGIRNAE